MQIGSTQTQKANYDVTQKRLGRNQIKNGKDHEKRREQRKSGRG